MPNTASTGNSLNNPSSIIALRARPAFLGRLKDEHDRAVELAVFGEVLRRAQQHRGMAVVSAGVHSSFVLRAMFERVEFVDGQRVHVGTQADGARAVPRFKTPTTPVFPKPAMYFDAPSFEIFGDQFRRADSLHNAVRDAHGSFVGAP